MYHKVKVYQSFVFLKNGLDALSLKMKIAYINTVEAGCTTRWTGTNKGLLDSKNPKFMTHEHSVGCHGQSPE